MTDSEKIEAVLENDVFVALPLYRANIAVFALRTSDTALIGSRAHGWIIIAGVDRGATGCRHHRERETAVVGQRAEHGICRTHLSACAPCGTPANNNAVTDGYRHACALVLDLQSSFLIPHDDIVQHHVYLA